jgi:hypothetical protein
MPEEKSKQEELDKAKKRRDEGYRAAKNPITSTEGADDPGTQEQEKSGDKANSEDKK